ncbi:MAG: hypothetical protein ABR587_02260 [Candidatus Binatia bacterium]
MRLFVVGIGPRDLRVQRLVLRENSRHAFRIGSRQGSNFIHCFLDWEIAAPV